MFKAAPVNPYDELVGKATSEDLISEDWDINLTICDKVNAEGEVGAKNVITSLLKRLSHRNPNVQIFALELSNSLYQNCNKFLHLELSSRVWTGAMDRLITDRTTLPKVKAIAVGYVKTWWEGLKGGEAEGVMGELVDSLKAKNVPLAEPAKQNSEDEAARRAREEEAELQRVLELSKQDQGGRSSRPAQPTAGGSSSGPSTSAPEASSSAYSSGPVSNPYQSLPQRQSYRTAVPQTEHRPFPAREPTPPPLPTLANASRVRAIYPFVTHEQGELSFEKGDTIKVIDRMYDEWYTGAVGGRIGIFPISYVEALPDLSTAELQKEAQEEARVFAAQGMIVNLQRTLDGLDISRGDRLDDPELEGLYQKVVELQPQIVSLMKKYADQRAELEHIHMGFVKASRQYASLTQQPQHASIGYRAPGQDPYAGQHAQVQQRQASYGSQQVQTGPEADSVAQQQAQAEHAAAWAAYYAQVAQQQRVQQASVDVSDAAQANHQQQYQEAAPAGQTQAERDQIAAAWQAYYAAQAQAQAHAHAQAQAHGQDSGPLPQDDSSAVPGQQYAANAQQAQGYQPMPVSRQEGSGSSVSHHMGQTQHQGSIPSIQQMPLSRSPDPASQPLLNEAPQAYNRPQLQEPVRSQLPNPYHLAGGSSPQPSHPRPSYHEQPSSPPAVAPKPAVLGSAHSEPQPHAQRASQSNGSVPYSHSPQALSAEQQQQYAHFPQQSQPEFHPQASYQQVLAVPASSPYGQGYNSAEQFSQGHLPTLSSHNAAPQPASALHGLERAVSNLSVGSQQVPAEARFQ